MGAGIGGGVGKGSGLGSLGAEVEEVAAKVEWGVGAE